MKDIVEMYEVTDKDFQACIDFLSESYGKAPEQWKIRMINYLEYSIWIFEK